MTSAHDRQGLPRQPLPSGRSRGDSASAAVVIVVVTLWPLTLSSDDTLKRSLRLVCQEACTIIDDLQHCVQAQLHASHRASQQLQAVRQRPHPAGTTPTVFRRISRLKVFGTSAPEAYQLPRLLHSVALHLTHVIRLDLHSVHCLSDRCAAAIATCTPHLLELTLVHDALDRPLADLAAHPPAVPHVQFYVSLGRLLHLTSLAGAVPTVHSHLLALAALTRLTRLVLQRNRDCRLDHAPLQALLLLRSLTLPFHQYPENQNPASATYHLAFDFVWVSRLVHLQELHDCADPTAASVHALHLCTGLTSLRALGLGPQCWARVPPPAPGAAAPRLALAALQELTFTEEVQMEHLRGLLRTVALPALRRLRAQIWLCDSEEAVEEDVAGVAEIVSRVPSAIAVFELKLYSEGDQVVEVGEERQAWLPEILRRLEELRESLARAGRVVSWETEHRPV